MNKILKLKFQLEFRIVCYLKSIFHVVIQNGFFIFQVFTILNSRLNMNKNTTYNKPESMPILLETTLRLSVK